jgi:Skp family chaperone for outer membrane proteins
MRTGTVITAVLLCAAFLFLGGRGTLADPAVSAGGCKVAVVSVRKVFEQCRRNGEYRERAEAERQQAEAELQDLGGRIESDRAQLPAFKTGSSEHLAIVREVLEKEASLQARKEFFKQKFELRDQRWTERLYLDILAAAGEVAKEMGLDLVLGVDEVQFPAASANELMLTIRTHSVLFNGGCPDVSDRVVARLDRVEVKDRQ